jgi:hypothetical protein
MKTEKMNLWQRCEALGPMEDQGVALAKHKGVWIMYIDGQQVFFAYEDGTINDICRAWLADAILQRFEAITNQGGTATELPTPENLPEPTYIVYALLRYIHPDNGGIGVSMIGGGYGVHYNNEPNNIAFLDSNPRCQRRG